MSGMFTEQIEVTRLPGGVRVVSEEVTHVQSVAIGLWVGVGSRNEEMPVRGITHLIEHMLFKGTSRRSARELADEVESRGGRLNAFTDKEFTCYYVRALAEHAEVAMDVLCDMLLNSLLDAEELRREKNVVLEEIKRHEDSPEDSVHDLFASALWRSHPLGRPTIGTTRTVMALEPEHLRTYMQRHYTPDRIVVAASGNIAHGQLVEMVARYLGRLEGAPHRSAERPPRPTCECRCVRKRTEQVHFCLGTQGFAHGDDDRYTLAIIDTALGGTMSSRLFQEIREKRGLAYSIGTYSVSYREGGLFVVYGGTSLETFDQVVDLSRKQLADIAEHGLTEEEIRGAKMHARGALVLGLEGMSNRMTRMGRSMIYMDQVTPIEEVLRKIEAVTPEDIIRVARSLFAPDRMTLTAIGPFAARRSKLQADSGKEVAACIA